MNVSIALALSGLALGFAGGFGWATLATRARADQLRREVDQTHRELLRTRQSLSLASRRMAELSSAASEAMNTLNADAMIQG